MAGEGHGASRAGCLQEAIEPPTLLNRGLRCRLFVGGSWLAKATVQAALASTPLDLIRDFKSDDPDFEQWVVWGKDIITTSVFAILVTAPAGLLFISYFGDRWLQRDCVGLKIAPSSSCLDASSGVLFCSLSYFGDRLNL